MILLCPMAIDPHGQMGPLTRRFLYSLHPNKPLIFGDTRPNTAEMYRRLVIAPYLSGILVMADINWKKRQLERNMFYGVTYTTPTSAEHTLQQVGLTVFGTNRVWM